MGKGVYIPASNGKSYLTLLLSDYKQQFTAPLHISGRGWIKVGTFAALTGAFAFADKPIQKAALKFRNNSGTKLAISSFITNTGGIYESITSGAF